MIDSNLPSEDIQFNKSDSEKLISNQTNKSTSHSLSTQASRNSTKFPELKNDEYFKDTNNTCNDLNLDSPENLKDFILQLSGEYDDLKSKYEYIFSSYEEIQIKEKHYLREISDLKEEVLKLSNKIEVYEIELYADYNQISNKRKSKLYPSGKNVLFPIMRKSSSFNSYMIKSRSNSNDQEDEIQKELNNLKNEVSKKELEIYNIKNEYEMKLHSMEEKYQNNLLDLELENSKLKENLCELQKMEFSLQIKISDLNEKIEIIEADKNSLKEEKVILENKRKKEKFVYRHEKEKLENENITLQKFLDESNTQFIKLDEVTFQLEKCQKEKEELIKNLKLKDEIVEGLHIQIENLGKEIKSKKSFRESLQGLNRVRLTLKRYQDIIFDEDKIYNRERGSIYNEEILKGLKANDCMDDLNSSRDSQEIPNCEEEENNYKTLQDCLLNFEEEENKKLQYIKSHEDEISENLISSNFNPKNLNTHNFFSQMSKETFNIGNYNSNFNSQNFFQKLCINNISNIEFCSNNVQICKEQINDNSITKDLDYEIPVLNKTIQELKYTLDDKEKINLDLTQEINRLNTLNESFCDQIFILKSNFENHKFEKEQEISNFRLRTKKIKECIEKRQYDVVLKTLNNI
jgi:hypothetical protein